MLLGLLESWQSLLGWLRSKRRREPRRRQGRPPPSVQVCRPVPLRTSAPQPSAALPSPSFPQLPTKQQAVVRCFPGHVSPLAEGPGPLWRRAGLKQVRKGSGSGQRSDTIVRGCASVHSAPTLLHSGYPSPNLRTVLRRQISLSDENVYE